MPARTPEELDRLFTEALNAGDLVPSSPYTSRERPLIRNQEAPWSLAPRLSGMA